MGKRRRFKFPPWFLYLWGGFNAGAVFGLFDAMLVMTFGLASFDTAGPIMGIIFIDAFGMGIVGVIAVSVGFLLTRKLSSSRNQVRSIISWTILMLISFGLTGKNLAWTFNKVEGHADANAENLLFLTVDTLRADSVGFGGHPSILSPCMDMLARRGWSFSNAVCPVPMTTPSHASLLTSTIPAVHGALENRYRLSPGNETVTEILKAVGYRTAAFVSCFPLDRRFGLDQGFMLYQDEFGVPGDLRQASWLRFVTAFSSRHFRERPARWTNSLVTPWIRRYASRSPFFLWIHYFEPHAPYQPTDEYQRSYRDAVSGFRQYSTENDWKKARAALGNPSVTPQPGLPESLYLGEISDVDHSIHEILLELARRDVLSGTVVVLVSDHGESFGEHGLFYTHGEDIYEPALTIPMVICGDKFPRKKIFPNLVSILDVTPTVLSKLRIPAGTEMEGFDLFNPARRRHGAFVENFGIIMAENAVKQRGIRGNRWKLISMEQDMELYDLLNDPREQHERSRMYPEMSQYFDRVVKQTFTEAQQKQKTLDIDISPETIEKLRALGYLS